MTTHTDSHTETLITSALVDAAKASVDGEITIYADPNCGGFAWQRWSADGENCESGPIGRDAADYGADRSDTVGDYENNMSAVRSALVAAGYEVAR